MGTFAPYTACTHKLLYFFSRLNDINYISAQYCIGLAFHSFLIIPFQMQD